MNDLHSLNRIGQSVWLDNLSRDLLQTGRLQELISRGVSGLTSNPSIFAKAIVGSERYREDLARAKAMDASPQLRLESLLIPDIQAACDLFRPVFEKSGGNDGYVSLEVSPDLAHDVRATIDQAKRLRQAVDRPNVLIKVPGTAAGQEALESLIEQGINVNVTLLFSVRQTVRTFEAYIRGLRKRHEQGLPLDHIKAVASLFLSRVDSHADKRLEALGSEAALALRGKLALATAKLAYERYLELFHGPHFADLRSAGARPQYLLWASTSTKNPAYPDLLYVEPLEGPETINTLPDVTLVALLEHGHVQSTLQDPHHSARDAWLEAEKLGISPDGVGDILQDEGLKLFSQSYGELLALVR
ncbi:MAG TPA: transaldolase [Thiobacillaceae bacterium]|nr:transaldolase [Thiobacillaceae bacterium]